MIASEARTRTTEVINIGAKACYERIHKAILEQVSAGNFFICVYDRVPDVVIERLKAEGYAVSYQSYRNETTVQISWEEPSPPLPLESDLGDAFAWGMP